MTAKQTKFKVKLRTKSNKQKYVFVNITPKPNRDITLNEVDMRREIIHRFIGTKYSVIEIVNITDLSTKE